MSYTDWVLDVTFWTPEAPLAFCPIEVETGDVITGLTVLGATPPGRMYAVVHMDGQAAVEKWMDEHPDVLAQLKRDLEAKDADRT
jgi:hypothetical protein